VHGRVRRSPGRHVERQICDDARRANVTHAGQKPHRPGGWPAAAGNILHPPAQKCIGALTFVVIDPEEAVKLGREYERVSPTSGTGSARGQPAGRLRSAR